MKRPEKRLISGKIHSDCRQTMWQTLLVWTFADLLAAAASILTADALGGLADAVFALETKLAAKSLSALLIYMAVTAVAVPAINYLSNVCMLSGALRHDRRVLSRFFDKSYVAAMKTDVGEVTQRMEEDPIDYRYFWLVIRVSLLTLPFTFMLLAWRMTGVSPSYALCTLALALTKLTVPLLVRKREAQFDRQTREYRSATRAREAELTTVPHTLRLLGLAERWRALLDTEFRRYYAITLRKKTVFDAVAGGAKALTDTAATLLILLIGALFVAEGSIGTGDVAAMLGYFGVLGEALEGLSYLFRKLPLMHGLEERMAVFYEEPERRGGKKPGCGAELSVEKITFGYDEKILLQDLSFQLWQGEKLAVAGANGTGKSTLIRLLTGLCTPAGGRIRMNGCDVTEADLSLWRRNLAVAMQEPWLCDGTVADNVRLGREDMTEAELSQILYAAGLAEIADKRVTDGEIPLSGGEKQRISLARALSRRAPLTILDEPSNHLDAAGREWLIGWIKSYHGTLICVSHDAALSELDDKIICL